MCMCFVFVIKLQLKSVGGQIRFDLIAFLRRESHWSAQDQFYFLRWFCFSSARGGVSANKVHVLAEMSGFFGLRLAVPRDR